MAADAALIDDDARADGALKKEPQDDASKVVRVPSLKKSNKMQDFMIDIRTPNSTRNRDNKAIQRLQIDLVEQIQNTKQNLVSSSRKDDK